MNEDELRAFLESATVGDEETDQPDAGVDADAVPTSALPVNATVAPLPPTEPIVVLPQRRSGSEPSFDELLGAGNPQAGVAPITLPGPPARPSVRTEPAPASPQPAPVSPEPAQSLLPTQPVPAPVPAPAGAQHPPISTAQLIADLGFDAPAPAGPEPVDAYEKISVTGGERSRPGFLPWIIVGAIAVIALVASVMIVLSVRGSDNAEAPAADAPAEAPATQEPAAPGTPDEPADGPADPETPETMGDEAPTVDVGQTGAFPIPDWGLTGEISAKFGWPQYRFEGDTLILSGGTLLPKFPESCAAMREGFGLTKLEDGTLEVHRPAETCAEATELYNQVWGLTAATIPTFTKE